MTRYKIKKLAEQIDSADAIIIGAGAGLSTSAGMNYSGKRFEENFSDFIAKYHFQDMYSGGFHQYPSLKEYWAYWSRYIWINRYLDLPGRAYTDLLELVQDKEYFVLTTNVDHCFQRSGFDKRRLFYTQGDYGLWQCSSPCHKKTYDNEGKVRQMVAEQKNMKIPDELVPLCPACGNPLSMNLRSDSTFVEDEGWHQSASRYSEFVKRHDKQHVLFLELGVGYNTPGIIKFPFWRMAYENSNSVYTCININEANAPKEIYGRSICIGIDIGHALSLIKKEL